MMVLGLLGIGVSGDEFIDLILPEMTKIYSMMDNV